MRHLLTTAIAFAALGCERQVTLPSVEASSPHFHYFATSADRIPNGILDRLEQHRADILGYLGFSDERVTNYYRFDRVEDFEYAVCGLQSQACTVGGKVFTTNVFDQHELTLAYLSNWLPAYVIAEGAAEAFHCGDILREWDFATPSSMDWTAVVGQSAPNPDIYRWGVRLVLYLLRTYGPARFLQYYQAAHLTDDPALFALEFERFWGVSIDQVWVVLVADLGSAPLPICPCGLPTVSMDGTSMAVSAFSDYRVLPPATNGQTIMLSMVVPGSKLARCAGGEGMPLSGAVATIATVPPLIPSTVAAILPDDQRYYVSFDGAGTISGQFAPLIQSECSMSNVLTVPDLNDYVAIAVPSRADATPWYIGLIDNASLYRSDNSPVSINLSSDCSFSSPIPLASGGTVDHLPWKLGLAVPPATPASSALEVVLFQALR